MKVAFTSTLPLTSLGWSSTISLTLTMRRRRPTESKKVATSWKLPFTFIAMGSLRVEAGRHLALRLDALDLEPGLLGAVLELLEQLVDVLLPRQLGQRLVQLLLEELALPPEAVQVVGDGGLLDVLGVELPLLRLGAR